MRHHYRSALVVGAGDGLSASVARAFAGAGMRIGLAARDKEKLAPLASELKAERFACDASKPADVEAMFKAAEAAFGGAPEVVVYNPSARVRGPLVDLDPEAVLNAISISAYGGFLVAQAAARRMLPKGQGAVLFTGASASVKGYANSSAFAMGKFALRGLAQSMARELAPKGIHVAHFVIDGGIRSARRPERQEAANSPDSMLDPDAIARTYFHVLEQDRSAWTWEIELRPWVERF
jgi:NAD(P)-dependent dehydrogenase (short-subunit alcohol dehydrogenase family)